LISLDYPSGALVVSEITKLSPLEPGNERLNLCGVSRIMIRIFSSTTAPILCGALLGGESERVFFAFFTLVFRKHTDYIDTPGFCRAMKLEEIQKHDYALTPGRYVRAEEGEDDDEAFADKMRRLTAQLDEQFTESARLEAEIRKNMQRLGFEVKI